MRRSSSRSGNATSRCSRSGSGRRLVAPFRYTTTKASSCRCWSTRTGARSSVVSTRPVFSRSRSRAVGVTGASMRTRPRARLVTRFGRSRSPATPWRPASAPKTVISSSSPSRCWPSSRSGSSTKAIAFYDRGNALFRLGRVVEARASYVEALRLDPTDRDAKFNIEVIDRILGLVRNGQPGQASSPPGQPSNVPNLNGQPGGSPGPTGPDGPGAAGGTPPPGANDRPTSSQQPSVQSALTDFRRDLTVDEALKLLDALKGEQRGIEGLVQGTGVRRGGNLDVPY